MNLSKYEGNRTLHTETLFWNSRSICRRKFDRKNWICIWAIWNYQRIETAEKRSSEHRHQPLHCNMLTFLRSATASPTKLIKRIIFINIFEGCLTVLSQLLNRAYICTNEASQPQSSLGYVNVHFDRKLKKHTKPDEWSVDHYVIIHWNETTCIQLRTRLFNLKLWSVWRSVSKCSRCLI